MVRSRVGQRILNQPARHGARSSGSRGGPESDRRAGLAWRRGHHAAPTFDEERVLGPGDRVRHRLGGARLLGGGRVFKSLPYAPIAPRSTLVIGRLGATPAP